MVTKNKSQQISRGRKYLCSVLVPLLVLLSVGPGDVFAEPGETGRVVGCIEASIDSGYRGVASLWDASSGRLPDPRRHIIIPSSFAVIRPDGCFDLYAPPGDYYVGAILRMTPGSQMGPPRVGDLVFMTPDKNHGSLRVSISASSVVDVGTRVDSWAYDGLQGDVDMGLSGTVVDESGQPVDGLLVFAFKDPEVSASPLAVSQRTGKDGRYQLRLDKPGRVYLRVKEKYGAGMPSPGGYVGVYGNKAPLPLRVEEGKVVNGVKITVLKVPEEMTGAKRMKQ